MSRKVMQRNYDNADYTTSTMMKDIPQLTSLFDDNNVVNKKEFTHMLHDNLARIRKEYSHFPMLDD